MREKNQAPSLSSVTLSMKATSSVATVRVILWSSLEMVRFHKARLHVFRRLQSWSSITARMRRVDRCKPPSDTTLAFILRCISIKRLGGVRKHVVSELFQAVIVSRLPEDISLT